MENRVCLRVKEDRSKNTVYGIRRFFDSSSAVANALTSSYHRDLRDGAGLA